MLDGQGHEIPVSQVIIAHKSESGEVERFSTIMRDIRDRKAADNALKEEQLRLTLALDAAQMGTWSCSLQTGELIWSDRAQEIFGFAPNTFPGDRNTFVAMIHPDDRDRVLEAITTTFETGAPYQLEYRIRRLDGEIRWIAVWGRMLLHMSSLEPQLVGVVVDISDRKTAEAQLRASEQRYATLTAAAPVGIFRTNAVGSCIYVNERWCEIAGLTPEAASGEGWQQGLHPDDRDRIGAEWYESARENRPFSLEYRFKSPDGRVTWVYGQSVAERDIQGNITGYVGTVTDINERKETEKELQRINQELARATRLKDEFLANMSHELRTPLTAILGMTEGLQEGVFGAVDEEHLIALETIEQSGLHLLALIDDILNLAKIESGQIELEYSSVAVDRMCESSLVFVKQQAGKKRIRLHHKITPNLPDITVDERRIRQVLINLLNNAVKFTPEEGQIVLEVMALLPDETRNYKILRFAVTDTGIGIAPEDLKKLFQPFIQVDSALNRQHDGTGLGLALVKRIVELHGGQVSVTSEVGVGSCFVFELPIQPLL